MSGYKEHPGGPFVAFYLEHREEILELAKKYNREGKHIPPNTPDYNESLDPDFRIMPWRW